jgi:hypothetical protein
MFLTEKCSGEIMACSLLMAAKMGEHIAKDKATAPRVSYDAIFM